MKRTKQRGSDRSVLVSTLGIALALLLTRPAFGQGSRTDYERARSMPDRVKGKVLNERLDARWIADDRLIHRRQTEVKQWVYVLTDASTGISTEAFDHAAIAGQLGEALGRDLDPDRLPFERFSLDGEDLLLLVEDDLRVFRIALSGERAEEIALDDAGPFRIEPTRRRRSRDGGGETTALFINRGGEPVRIIWLDRQGEPREYAKLEPGARHRQHTFVGHVWQVLAADDRELGVYTARAGLGVVIIDGVVHVAPPESDSEPPNVSPDGRLLALIRDHDVWVRDVATGEEVAISSDGTAEDRYTGRLAWSPDSSKLAVIRQKPEQSHTIHMIAAAPRDQVQPKMQSMQYLKPGDRIAHPRPCLFDVEQRRQIPIADDLFALPWAITRLDWRPDGSAFEFLYNQRGHQVMRLIAIDAETGEARAIIDERAETFIDYSNKTFLHRVEGSDELIWMSERDGWNHLYLVDGVSGTLHHPITSGEWVVRGVERVDDETRQVWFRAMGVFADQDPYHVHYGRVGFDGAGLTWLTHGDGTHALSFSPDRTHFVDTYSRVDLAPVHELRRSADGGLVCTLERADWTPLLETGWRPPQRFVAKGRDGVTDIWGILIFPSNFDPFVRYPVVENIYAGPHGFFVPKRFRPWPQSREIAELGFIVVRIDGMGTNWRSRAFHDVAWKNIGDSGFPDRIAWIEAAARERPFMDLARVGIYGGSAGGQSALRGLLAHGEFYHAGVADCGCHDNRMDKIWWNEAWMGWPIGPHYEEQSNVTNAHRLEGELLLVVGELDRNVDPASTMQVVDALIKADKDFELLVIPGQGHGAAETPYGRRRRQDFFVRHLLGVEPRRETSGREE